MDGPRRCSCANTFLTDDDYVDWPVLPEAPSSLAAVVSGARCGYAGKGTAAIYATPLSSDVSAKLARGRASPRSRRAPRLCGYWRFGGRHDLLPRQGHGCQRRIGLLQYRACQAVSRHETELLRCLSRKSHRCRFGLFACQAHQIWVMPPSTTSSMPVT